MLKSSRVVMNLWVRERNKKLFLKVTRESFFC